MFRRHTVAGRAAALVGAAILALTLLPAAAATAAPQLPAAPQVPADDARVAAGAPGIAARPNGLVYLGAEAQADVLDGMLAAKATWVRFDLAWKDVQPDNANQWEWSTYDRLVAGITSRGMRPLAVIGKTPRWAVVGDCANAPYPDICTPATADFARFAGVAARHYSRTGQPQVRHWEVWNEPNNIAAWLHPSPRYYGNLLVAASQAIRRSEPDAFVLTGGLAPLGNDEYGNIDEVDFLRKVYRVQGIGRSFDAVAAHPYSFPDLPRGDRDDSGWSELARSDPSLRSVMVNNGDGGKKIWLTEFGAPTGGDRAVSEDQQALAIKQAFTLARSYAWAGPLFVYTWQDTPPTDDSSESYYGLLRRDGSPKPAYGVFVAAAG